MAAEHSVNPHIQGGCSRAIVSGFRWCGGEHHAGIKVKSREREGSAHKPPPIMDRWWVVPSDAGRASAACARSCTLLRGLGTSHRLPTHSLLFLFFRKTSNSNVYTLSPSSSFCLLLPTVRHSHCQPTSQPESSQPRPGPCRTTPDRPCCRLVWTTGDCRYYPPSHLQFSRHLAVALGLSVLLSFSNSVLFATA
jgi:hypothetical protein